MDLGCYLRLLSPCWDLCSPDTQWHWTQRVSGLQSGFQLVDHSPRLYKIPNLVCSLYERAIFVFTNRCVVSRPKSDSDIHLFRLPPCWYKKLFLVPCPAYKISDWSIGCDVIKAGGNRHGQNLLWISQVWPDAVGIPGLFKSNIRVGFRREPEVPKSV